MRREYTDSMQVRGFNEFITACDELRKCKYILAENKIAALLKSIADNAQLYSMFNALLYNFNYRATFDECIVGSTLTLPASPQKAIALVFRILVDIDSGKMNLQKLLETYFYGESLNDSFARMGLELIAPFESYCKMCFAQLSASTTDAPQPPKPQPRPTVAPAVQAPPSRAEEIRNERNNMGKTVVEVNEKLQNEIKANAISCVDELLVIAETAIIGKIDQAEFVACIDGLKRALRRNGSYEDIVSSFLGVKYAVSYFFKSSKTVMDIYKRLEYDIKNINI